MALKGFSQKHFGDADADMENDPLPHNMFFRRYFLKATLTGIKNEQKDGQTDNTNYVVNF